MNQQPCKTLPPVGVVCEYDDCEKGWVRTRILAHHPGGTCAWHESVEPDGFEGDRTYSTDSAPAFRLIPDDAPGWDGKSWPPPEGERVRVRLSGRAKPLPGTVMAAGHNEEDVIRIAVKTDCGRLPTYSGLNGIRGPMVLPLHSEEEQAVEEMARVVERHSSGLFDDEPEHVARALYRAGCRMSGGEP